MKKHKIPKAVEDGFFYAAISLAGLCMILLIMQAHDYIQMQVFLTSMGY